MGLIDALMETVFNGTKENKKEPKFPIMKGTKEVFNSRLVLKDFYNDLHDKLVEEDFIDMLEPGHHKSDAELPEAKHNENFNRTGDMFEHEFAVIDNGWAKEIEIKWKAMCDVPYSNHGKFIFELDLTARDVQDKEILIGNKKKTVQLAKWEFRNTIWYKNEVMDEHINKIPFLKHFPNIKWAYFKMFYKDQLNRDLDQVFGKLKPKIYGVIHKHFRDEAF